MHFIHSKIFWQALIPDGTMYTGNYSTHMKFILKKVYTNGVSSFKVILTSQSQNIQPSTFTWYLIN